MSFVLELPSETISLQDGQKIAELYDLGRLRNISGLFGGLRGRAYLVEAEKGRFVFKTYGVKFSQDQLLSSINTLQFLDKFDLKVPKVFPTKNDADMLTYQGPKEKERGIMLSFVPGNYLMEGEVTTKSFQQAAYEVLRLHIALKDCPDVSFEKKEDSLEKWEDILAGMDNLISGLKQSELVKLGISRKVLERIRLFLEKGCRELSESDFGTHYQLIHGDLWKTNFIYEKGELSVLVDFDWVGLGLIEDDWAKFLGEWMSVSVDGVGWNDCVNFVIGRARKNGAKYFLSKRQLELRTVVSLLQLAGDFLGAIIKREDPDALSCVGRWYNERIEKIKFLIPDG
ncbi:phosphotransferase [Patescibacteria group bacterium]|nr:phosphotransferase [Patescibacteria group bacterium]